MIKHNEKEHCWERNFARNNTAVNHKNISRKNYRVSQKKSVLLSDLLEENVELITIVNVCQVFFDSPCRESVEKKCIFTSNHYRKLFFFVQKAIKSRIDSHYRKSIPTNENKKSKKNFFSQFC